jgi:hypothetical protein
MSVGQTKPEELARRALERIAKCNDPMELRRIADYAKALANDEVRDAALRKLYEISPDAEPGTLEHDVWQSIFALEGSLKEEKGKTILLSRTRQKIARDGEVVTVADLVMKPADRFNADVLEAASNRLTASGVR